MERRLVLHASLGIPSGHRLDVTEQIEEPLGDASVLSIVDLDTGIRYRHIDEVRGEIVRWTGRVLDCTVTIGGGAIGGGAIGGGAIGGGVMSTTLRVEVDAEPPSAGGGEARTALHGADAAVDAAKAEADRWGGGDRIPEPEPERFW